MCTLQQSLLKKLNTFWALRGIFIQRQTSATGLYQGQLPILEYIVAYPGCMQNDIAEHLHISAASVAASTKRLQKAGFLKKQVDAHNLRCNQLFITKEGTQAVQNCRQVLNEFDNYCFSDFSEEDLQSLEKLLTRMIDNITQNNDEKIFCLHDFLLKRPHNQGGYADEQ